MKCLVYLYLTLLVTSNLIAGDTPCGATLLSTNVQSFISFDNTFNTNSSVAPPPYGGYIGPDTWISFIMPVGGFYLITNGNTMIDPAIAVYSGPCTNPKLLYNVLDNNCNGAPSPLLYIDKLTPGEQYFIRVWAQDGSPNGIFDIKLVQNITGLPDFIAFADATIVGECIELTQNTTNQQGCAWFQNPIDFTMPFSHEMTANFGTLNGSGADGICLVYQSNGQDFCGGTGQGIGAGGMPKSAIFEFDTWQNGDFADPSDDHCAFNINGDMNHNNSIEGPISLGNIEDGLDHTILFEWEPAGNQYLLYFDGVLILSGSFDIINNCFGGSTTAFWGYTSATGAATNLQTICPIVDISQPSFTEYNEVDICAGESFMGHTESGFYIDLIPGIDGCQYQLNTLLNVHSLPEPYYLNEVICEGEFILVADQVYTLPNEYEIYTINEFGCDSLIYLDLENIVTNVVIDTPSLISCKDSSILLIPNPSSNFDITSVSYTWSGNQTTTNQDILQVNIAGEYFLTALIVSNGEQCLSSTGITVEIDTTSPFFPSVSDVFLDCTNFSSDTLLFVSELENNVQPTWIYEDSIISHLDTANIIGEGIYTIIATDTINGCQVADSLMVTISSDIPVIDLDIEDLNCQNTAIEPYFTVSGVIDSFLWTMDDQIFSYDSIPIINQAGDYNITVINKDGCKTSASFNVGIDTIKPTVELQDFEIPCDILSTSLTLNPDSNLIVEWHGPDIVADSSHSISIVESGWYHLIVTDPDNLCTNSDSSFVQFKGSTPNISIEGDTLSCKIPSAMLSLSSDQADLSLEWTFQEGYYGNSSTIPVVQDGWYYIYVVNENGCDTNDSIQIFSNFTTPEIDITFDTINCIQSSALIDANIINGDSIFWIGPNAFQSSEASFTTSTTGTFILSAINEGSGCESLDTVSIIDNSVIPEFEINPDTLTCNSNNLFLPFSVSTPYLELVWTGPEGFISDSINPNISLRGEYFVHIEFEGECTLDTSLVVSQDIAPPTYSIQYDSITCLSPQVTFTTYLDDDNSSFTFISPSGESTSSIQYSSTEPGLYYFFVEGANGCQSTDSFLVASYLDLPEVTISDLDSITCSNPEVSILTHSNVDNLIYDWVGPNNFNSDFKDIFPKEGGSYTLIATNEYGCQIEMELFVESFFESPDVALEGNHIYCDQQTSTIAYITTDQLSGINWQSENSFVDFKDSIVTKEAGWYSITVENQFGCSHSDSIFIEANTNIPELNLLTADTIIVDADTPNGQIQIEVASGTDYEINWFPEMGLSCFTCLDPVVISADNPFYEVFIIDENGCSASEIVHIRYQEDLKVHIPNVFSPGNNDGSNDHFTIYGNENIQIVNSMMIYDRWGELVAKKENFKPNIPSIGWDGHITGKLGVSGVYVYSFQITTTAGEILSFYGDLTLL